MCARAMRKVLYRVAVGVAAVSISAGSAYAQEARLGSPKFTAPVSASQANATSSNQVALSVITPLTLGSLTPTFGAMSIGVAPDSPFGTIPLFGANSLVSPDFSASYLTAFNRSEVGLFAGYSGGASLFSAAPTAGWNFGASVGYAGFYLQAGISDNSGAQQRLNGDLKVDPKQGWLAGFGYRAGALNLRLSYMAAQSVTSSEPDSRTWMIGGIYQLSSRLRLNADAFTSPRAAAVSNPAAATNAAAPQGTGARVGVQLRF